MTFNSLSFLIFAAVFFAIWPFVSKHNQLRWGLITLASFVFYGWWDWRFCFLLLATGFFDYCMGISMARFPSRRRVLLAASIAANVGALMVFKYGNFITENLNRLVLPFAHCQIPAASILLPIGISFYTFHSMSYLFDVYRGKIPPAKNVLHFFSYLTMFPHLVAGPIIRGADMLPQLEKYNPVSEQDRWEGTWLIAVGYAKKTIVADNLAPIVNLAFGADAPALSAFYWWAVMFCFALQIYCDFSGYTDIARGLARWMGVRFPLNFNNPYLSVGFRDFWTRWHISLSSWFKDYVYIPLGGARPTQGRKLASLWITMLVSGLWHGAAWNFVLWGGIHASYLTVERFTNWHRRCHRLLSISITFVLVLVAWVFFRAESAGQALHIVTIMFSPSYASWIPGCIPWTAAAAAGVMIVCELGVLTKTRLLTSELFTSAKPALASALLIASVFLRGPGNTFIYFQF